MAGEPQSPQGLVQRIQPAHVENVVFIGTVSGSVYMEQHVVLQLCIQPEVGHEKSYRCFLRTCVCVQGKSTKHLAAALKCPRCTHAEGRIEAGRPSLEPHPSRCRRCWQQLARCRWLAGRPYPNQTPHLGPATAWES